MKILSKDKGEIIETKPDILDDSDLASNIMAFNKRVNDIWGHSTKGMEAKKAAMTMLSTKTGMYAKIPIVCKADDCPYSETCQLLPYNLSPIGEPCPIETAEIELRYAGYDSDFDIENASFTDKVLIATLINHDIMIERCKALISKNKVLVENVVAGISEQGEEFTRPEISKHLEALEKIEKKRDNVYSMMVATRKDKKSVGEKEKSLSDIMAEAINQSFIVEEKPNEFIDIEEDDVKKD